MKIEILTLFPEMFQGPFDASIIKKAQEKDLVEINIHNLRDWGLGERKTVDDRPYGGGLGMVLRVDVIDAAIKKLKSQDKTSKTKVVLLDAGGEKFNQKKALRLAKLQRLILICGHYEGVDERIKEFVDEEISIGDYVLTGGEIPTMVIVDSIVRLLPGVLEKEAVENESFSLNTEKGAALEYPQYTRPEEYEGQKVPEILLSGNHKEIEKWRGQKSQEKTKRVRPDLFKKIN